jgi:hypothetical protein
LVTLFPVFVSVFKTNKIHFLEAFNEFSLAAGLVAFVMNLLNEMAIFRIKD